MVRMHKQNRDAENMEKVFGLMDRDGKPFHEHQLNWNLDLKLAVLGLENSQASL